jgi:membrane fusion protein (multidrug efflux system)
MNTNETSLNTHRNGAVESPRHSIADKEKLQPLPEVLPLPAGSAKPKARFAFNRTWLIRLIASVVVLLGAPVGVGYFIHSLAWESTDDAFVEGHVLQVSAKIANQVQRVLIDDNQYVQKGDLLVKIDDRDYQVAFEEAGANYAKAQSDFGRISNLLATHAVSQGDFDAAKASLDVTKSRLDQARLNLAYTEIRAPESGKVTRKNVEPGDYLQVGQTVCAIVPQTFWVLANFKETQLAHMHPGQKVLLTPDIDTHDAVNGHVDSVAPATGALFSLLPPENATGNFTKVVQRIPVKIVIDKPDATHAGWLRAGLSVTAEVDTRGPDSVRLGIVGSALRTLGMK